jgi:hypothetical protein
MPDINQAMKDLGDAAKEFNDARAEEEAAQKDEAAKLARWHAAGKAVMRAKGKEATEKAGSEYHDADAAWRSANTKRKEATRSGWRPKERSDRSGNNSTTRF